jgi:hypothetical protein
MDQAITDDPVRAPLTGTEIVPVVVPGTPGTNERTTTGDIAALAPSTPPGGAARQVQFNNGSGGFGGSTRTTIDTAGVLRLEFPQVGDPLTPSPPSTADPAVLVFAREFAKRGLPCFVGSSGLDTPVQPHLGFSKIGTFNPGGSATSLPGIFGIPQFSSSGTVTNRTPAFGSGLLASLRRLGLNTAVAANNSAGFRLNSLVFWRGDAPGLGGFFITWRFGLAAMNADGRLYQGLIGSTALVSGDPSSNVNLIGLGKDAGDTNLQIMHNDNAGTATKIDLGSAFAVNVDIVWELVLFAAPNAAEVHYMVRRLNHATAPVVGTITTDLPAADQGLGWNSAFNTGPTTATAVLGDVINGTFDTDF